MQVAADSVWASEGASPLNVARKGPVGAWEIPDGADQPATYRQLLGVRPPAGSGSTEIEEWAGPPGLL